MFQKEFETDDGISLLTIVGAVVVSAKLTPKEAKRQQRHRKIRSKVRRVFVEPRRRRALVPKCFIQSFDCVRF
jgi:hypothetical protein